jgi:hypothetical protein
VVLLVLASPLRHFAKRSAMTGDYIMRFCVLYSFSVAGKINSLIAKILEGKGKEKVPNHVQ